MDWQGVGCARDAKIKLMVKGKFKETRLVDMNPFLLFLFTAHITSTIFYHL